MILYQFGGGDGLGSISPPCLKVEMALKLMDLEYEVKNLRTRSEVRKVSRTGRLPMLEVEGHQISDSNTILDHLEMQHPDSGLSPQDPIEKVNDRLWEHYITDNLYWSGFYLRWVHPEYRDLFVTNLLKGLPAPVRWLIRLRVLPVQLRRARMHGSAGKSFDEIMDTLKRAIAMIETGLEEGPFLQGRKRPGRGDLAVTALLIQCGFRDTMPATKELVLQHPVIMEYLRNVLEACNMKVPHWIAP
jgi:glutathione S-transferase